jgi:hypothetical protein
MESTRGLFHHRKGPNMDNTVVWGSNDLQECRDLVALEAAKIQLIPIGDYPWGEVGNDMVTLTCKNHPTAEYSTKNPWLRGIHIHKYPDGWRSECPCPFGDLAVVVE